MSKEIRNNTKTLESAQITVLMEISGQWIFQSDRVYQYHPTSFTNRAELNYCYS